MFEERLLALIANELKRRGLSMRKASLEAGLGADAIRNIKRGKSKQPRLETLQKLATFLEIKIPIREVHGEYPQPSSNLNIDAGLPKPNARLTDSVAIPAVQQLKRDVPILGITVGGLDGSCQLNGEVVDMARRPPGVTDATAFALYVYGDSMSPRFERGDMVFVTRSRPAQPGNDVVVEMQPQDGELVGQCFIKRLVKLTAEKLILREFNPPRDFEISRGQVKAVLRIYTPAEMMGAG